MLDGPEFLPMKARTVQQSSHREVVVEHPNDLEDQRLIGSTRFEPRTDIKNILITGGAGFIGGWVTRHLAVQYPEYNIICFDKLDVVASLYNVRCLKSRPNFRFVHGDLTDEAAVSQVMEDYDIDCVMHFAAYSHVQNSFSDPSGFTLNNVIATQRLLDAVRARQGRVRRFIHVSTDEVYGDANEEFFDENQQLKPTNPYSASKAAAEMYVWAYSQSFNIPSVVVRSNNVYGPCQYPEKIIPRFCILLDNQQPLTIQGSGLNVRRYLYGGDAADAFDTLLHKGVIGEAYNVQSDFPVTNLEVAVRTLELFGYSPKRDFGRCLSWIADRPFNDTDYRVDGSKLLNLGWRQRVSFPEGLTATVNWYRKNMHAWWPQINKTVNLASQEMAKGRLGNGINDDAQEDSDIQISGASTPVVIDC